jgi:hypothetical protein
MTGLDDLFGSDAAKNASNALPQADADPGTSEHDQALAQLRADRKLAQLLDSQAADRAAAMPVAARTNAPPQASRPSDFLAPDNIPYGQFVERATNQALSEAGVLSTRYDDPDILAAAWGQAMGSLGEMFNTEIGSRIYQVGGKWAAAPAKSNGADNSQGIGHVNVGAGPTLHDRGAVERGSIHTHGNNLGFSAADNGITERNANFDRLPWSGYIVDHNHEIYRYDAPGGSLRKVK